MGHPLEDVIRSADGFLLIGDSSEDRFPAYSYHNYTTVGKRFYCLDLGGLSESRGATKGGKVYTAVSELPEDRDDLAVIWVKPRSAARAVDVAHEAGCKRVWFSFGSGHRDAAARARESTEWRSWRSVGARSTTWTRRSSRAKHTRSWSRSRAPMACRRKPTRTRSIAR